MEYLMHTERQFRDFSVLRSLQGYTYRRALFRINNALFKMSKSLYAAYQLAAENHDLDHYKNVLREFEASCRRDEKAAQLLPSEDQKS
jgi:hypothetical protein